MNRKDKAFLNKISAELKREAENISLPDSLSAESIAELIKNNAGTVSPDENIAAVPERNFKVLATPSRKVLATAAALVIIIASAFAYRNIDRPPLGTDQSAEAGTEDNIANSDISDTGISSTASTDETKGFAGNKVSDKKQGDENAAEQLQINVEGVKTASSYSEIENRIKKAYKKSNSPGLIANIFGLFATKGSLAGDAAPNARAEESNSIGSAQGFGKTNEQVAGVAEGDIIKNDGRYLYVFSTRGIQIIDTADNSLVRTALIPLSDINKADPNSEEYKTNVYSTYYGSDVRELYVLNNRLAAVTSLYKPVYKGDTVYQNKRVTNVTVFDISDKSNPKELLFYSQDGYYVSSRLYNGRLSLVTNYGVAYGDERIVEEAGIPKTNINGSASRIALNDILIPDDSAANNFLVVGLIDKLEKGSKIDTKAVLGGAANIYSSGDNLLTARTIYQNDNVGIFNFGNTANVAEKSEILAFNLKDGTIRLTARGLVDGDLLNQFSMDEKDGYYRIATTDSKGNNVFVLDKDLKVKGAVTGFARGEHIKSVRFMGNTAYVVTFVQTDPLFVIDLSDPSRPIIMGELKIPGFSQYLHPIENNLIIGIGRGGTDTGVNNDAKISLFDVSDPTSPKELDAISMKDSYINTDHKAFLSVPERKMYVITVTRSMTNGDVYYRDITELTGFSVENRKIAIKNSYTMDYATNMLRGTYIGNVIYAIDPQYGIYALNMDTKELIDSIMY